MPDMFPETVMMGVIGTFAFFALVVLIKHQIGAPDIRPIYAKPKIKVLPEGGSGSCSSDGHCDWGQGNPVHDNCDQLGAELNAKAEAIAYGTYFNNDPDTGTVPVGNALRESQAETQVIYREQYPTTIERTSTGPAVVHVRVGRG